MSYWEILTDGLLLHEVILLMLGSLLFLVLLFLVLLFAFRRERLRSLLFFFTIPLVMIGWPSITKIQISQAGIALENNLRNYQVDPANKESREALQASMEVLENKGVQNPESLVNIAKAKYLLGKDTEALQTIDRIPDEVKDEVGADELKATIAITQDIERKLRQVEHAPTADNLEILRISKDQLVNHEATNNVRLREYVVRSDSLIKKSR
ncbi:hypothetical protein [Parapedobacter tibetensis]|uniref:hypothetical protein n=1 Tax=Parapedobacter tibetensis TaxID=2972951 RepID=UPI00214D55F2|nr:hypothetical protein [Parapedobacter tibetensis]